MNKPKRMYELTIKVGANSREDLARAIDGWLVPKLEERDLDGVTGGVDYGGYVHLEYSEEQTQEKYADELHKYIAYTRAIKEAHGAKVQEEADRDRSVSTDDGNKMG